MPELATCDERRPVSNVTAYSIPRASAMASQAQVGRLTAVVRAAVLIVDIDNLLHPRGRSGCLPLRGRGNKPRVAAGLLAPDRRSPHLPGLAAHWHFEVCSPVTVAGPRPGPTRSPPPTGGTVNPPPPRGALPRPPDPPPRPHPAAPPPPPP